MHTVSAATWHEAKAAWSTGSYGTKWAPWRKLAAAAGLLYPPTGDPSEQWSADEPSQRALVARSMAEDPELLRFALSQPVHTWRDVLNIVLDERDAATAAAEQAERAYRQQKASYASHQEAATSLAGIMEVLADSVGTAPPAPVASAAAVNAYREALRLRWWAWHNEQHTSETASAVNASGLCLYDACRMMREILEAPMDSE